MDVKVNEDIETKGGIPILLKNVDSFSSENFLESNVSGDGVFDYSHRTNSPGNNMNKRSVSCNSTSNSDSSNSYTRKSGASVNSEKILFQGFNLNYLRRTDSKDSDGVLHKRRSYSVGSDEWSDEYGWFADFDSSPNGFIKFRKGSSSTINSGSSNNSDSPDGSGSKRHLQTKRNRTVSLPLPASETPMYILESALPTQRLWYETAGKRPKQPDEERKYFERLWLQNFENSSVTYQPNGNVMGSYEDHHGINRNENENDHKSSLDEQGEEIMYKGRGPFSNAVSKAFLVHGFSTMTLQIPRFKISKDKDGVIFASFLVVMAIDGVTFGVWKRHTDFKNLADKLIKVVKANASITDNDTSHHSCNHDNVGINEIDGAEGEVNRNLDSNNVDGGVDFKNSLLSWQCLIYRKQWFRCLDKGKQSIRKIK